MNADFPKGFVIEAWNAIVGASLDSTLIQCAVTLVGSRSHLLSTKMRCLCAALRRMKASTCSARVPMGSRASSTSTTTSDESTTRSTSPRMRRDMPASKTFSRAATVKSSVLSMLESPASV